MHCRWKAPTNALDALFYKVHRSAYGRRIRWDSYAFERKWLVASQFLQCHTSRPNIKRTSETVEASMLRGSQWHSHHLRGRVYRWCTHPTVPFDEALDQTTALKTCRQQRECSSAILERLRVEKGSIPGQPRVPILLALPDSSWYTRWPGTRSVSQQSLSTQRAPIPVLEDPKRTSHKRWRHVAYSNHLRVHPYDQRKDEKFEVSRRVLQDLQNVHNSSLKAKQPRKLSSPKSKCILSSMTILERPK